MRVAIAIMIGFAAANLSLWHLIHTGGNAADYTWAWRGIRDLFAGHDPYVRAWLPGPLHYPANAPLYYPLPAVLSALPVAFFPASLAGALFVGFSFGLLAYALTNASWWPLLMLASPSAYSAFESTQWSPLLLALTLLPLSGALLPLLKPNLGIPLAFWSGFSWRGLLLSGAVGLMSLTILPTWPLDLLHNLGESRHTIPLLTPYGLLLLLALVGIRRREGRLLLSMALFPQRMIFYDQLPLLLIARTKRQLLTLLATNWLGYEAWSFASGLQSRHRVDDIIAPYTMLACYLPALVLVLWQARPSSVSAPILENQPDISLTPASATESAIGTPRFFVRLQRWPVNLITWRALRLNWSQSRTRH
jgi:hypothetical protein